MAKSETMSLERPAAKRLKTGETVAAASSFVTWNCNGFVSRCKWNVEEMEKLVSDTGHPDVICLQEVRLKASSHSRGEALQSEQDIVREVIEKTVFKDYDKFWSLSDKRYAGTLTLVHKRIGFHGRTAFTPAGAINLLIDHYSVTRQEIGLPSEENNEVPQKKQTSLKSFFTPKVSAQPTASNVSKQHNSDGRFQFLQFESMDLIHTYVPNNGSKRESYVRRKEWDDEMNNLLATRQKILNHAQIHDRPLLWLGDMNCAKDYRDGTHWQTTADGGICEWWTDENKCLVEAQRKKLDKNRHTDNIGIASFTPGERRRFAELLETGKFVDVWREMHPNGTSENKANAWDGPDFTWRGHLSTGNFKSKYEGKGQRIDYFLLSPPSKLSQVQSCDILGYGADRRGHFCGSDHCASVMILKDACGKSRSDS